MIYSTTYIRSALFILLVFSVPCAMAHDYDYKEEEYSYIEKPGSLKEAYSVLRERFLSTKEAVKYNEMEIVNKNSYHINAALDFIKTRLGGKSSETLIHSLKHLNYEMKEISEGKSEKKLQDVFPEFENKVNFILMLIEPRPRS